MKRDITTALVNEHVLIKRMLTLLERNAPRTGEGSYPDYCFYLDGVDFIRNYADRFHHAKEEDVLFAALIANGMPREHSPAAAMLMEHDQGRAFVRAMEEAAEAALAGRPGQERLIAANALAYAALLREHITKEDEILYPLAERIIPAEVRDTILAGYARAEQSVPVGLEERYAELVARYEAAAVQQAA
jgi:hemerythrin-like domain-containing protein